MLQHDDITSPRRSAKARALATSRSRGATPAPLWMLVLAALLFLGVVGSAVGLVIVLKQRTAEAPGITKLRAQTTKSDDGQIKTQLGYALQQQGRFEDAVGIYDAVVQSQPKNLGALYNRGVCELALGRSEKGVSSLKRVLAIAPAHVLAADSLGEYYLKAGQYQMVVSTVKIAADKNPNMSDLHLLLARGLERTGKRDEARIEYKQALTTNPELTEATAGLGRLSKQ